MKKRIWELDALRGLFVLGMVLVHLIYDLQNFLHLEILADSRVFQFVMDWGGALFFVISGICVTLGSHPIRRGMIVLGCGLVVSLATWGLYALDFAEKGLIIYFGVLHCLGVCMLLWPLFKHIPWPVLAVLSAVMIVVGVRIDAMRFACSMWLIPLGFKPWSFESSDYFALLPFFGFFLLGAIFGKKVYKNKTTLFPKVNPNDFPVCVLIWVGKWSLLIYLLHQPVLTGLVFLLEV